MPHVLISTIVTQGAAWSTISSSGWSYGGRTIELAVVGSYAQPSARWACRFGAERHHCIGGKCTDQGLNGTQGGQCDCRIHQWNGPPEPCCPTRRSDYHDDIRPF